MSSDNFKDYNNELRRALYPDGMKHPQQGEWWYMMAHVRGLVAKAREYDSLVVDGLCSFCRNRLPSSE